MRLVMGMCQRRTVMDFGQVIARGIPSEIRGDSRVIEAYLGEDVPFEGGGIQEKARNNTTDGIMLLTIENLSVYHGNIKALHEISFSVGRGQIVSLIGANGAGKSTILKAIAGILTPRSGKILLAGGGLVGVPPATNLRVGGFLWRGG